MLMMRWIHKSHRPLQNSLLEPRLRTTASVMSSVSVSTLTQCDPVSDVQVTLDQELVQQQVAETGGNIRTTVVTLQVVIWNM